MQANKEDTMGQSFHKFGISPVAFCPTLTEVMLKKSPPILAQGKSDQVQGA